MIISLLVVSSPDLNTMTAATFHYQCRAGVIVASRCHFIKTQRHVKVAVHCRLLSLTLHHWNRSDAFAQFFLSSMLRGDRQQIENRRIVACASDGRTHFNRNL